MESAIREVGKVQTDKNSARARRNSHEAIPRITNARRLRGLELVDGMTR